MMHGHLLKVVCFSIISYVENTRYFQGINGLNQQFNGQYDDLNENRCGFHS